MKVGVLALQGNFGTHVGVLRGLGLEAFAITRADELSSLRALVLPGGESSTLLKLMDRGFRLSLLEAVDSGLALFGVCAGAIVLGSKVSNPAQDSLGLIDVDLQRNAYGRQLDSFVDGKILWQCEREDLGITPSSSCEGVFIRAPLISRVGSSVEVLLRRSTGEAVMVRGGSAQGKKVMIATFHPELAPVPSRKIYDYFLSIVS